MITDRNELEAAETYLNHAAATNFTTFIKMLSDVLVQGSNSQVARMAAGLQLKNHLTSKDATFKVQYQQRWLALPEDIRLYIKKNVRFISKSNKKYQLEEYYYDYFISVSKQSFSFCTNCST